jgi:hypothetical protein
MIHPDDNYCNEDIEMEDRELLELAAKGAGINGVYLAETIAYGGGMLVSDLKILVWNPLLDDGDALRSAAQKGISIIHEHPAYVLAKRMRGGEWFKCIVDGPDDYERATRCAITHCLAQIGENLP